MSTGHHRADVFVPAQDDPRTDVPNTADERTTLLGHLAWHRETLALKCDGLSPEQLARRAVPPSTLSLLGLVRHMADVELGWFRKVMAGQDVAHHFRTPDLLDEAFDGAVADADVVAEAFATWRREIDFSDRFVAEAGSLDVVGQDPHEGLISLRELLVHMVEEYARHNGHADLLRECIDGRIGQ